MPLKAKAKAKSKSVSKASNKTTVIVNVGKTKTGKARRASNAPVKSATALSPQIISIQNPGADSMLRDIQYAMNKLNMQSANAQSLNAQSPVAPPPMPVVQQVQQTLPKLPGIGALGTGERTPVREMPSVFTNDIFQMTPREEEPAPPPFVFPFQPAIPSTSAAPAASMPQPSAKSLAPDELAEALAAIPMEEKKDKKTGKMVMKPKRGFTETYKRLVKQQTKAVRMKK